MKQRCGAGPMGGGRRLNRLLLCSWMVLCIPLLQGNAVTNALPFSEGPTTPPKDNAVVNALPARGSGGLTTNSTSSLRNYDTTNPKPVEGNKPEPELATEPTVEPIAEPESVAEPKAKSTAEPGHVTVPKTNPTAETEPTSDPGAKRANLTDVATSTEPEATTKPTGRHSGGTTLHPRLRTDGGGNKSTDSTSAVPGKPSSSNRNEYTFPVTVKPLPSDKNEYTIPVTVKPSSSNRNESTEHSKADVVSVISNIKIINSSIQLEESAEYGPNKAIDNNTETYWNANVSYPNEVYITFELDNKYTVSSINLLNFENDTNDVTEVKLEASDDKKIWDENILNTEENATETSEWQTFDGFTAIGKFLRLTLTDRREICLSEIKFMGFAGIATTTPIPATIPATTPAVSTLTNTPLTTVKKTEAATTTPSPATTPADPIVTNTTQTPIIKPLKPGTDSTDITAIDPDYIDHTTDYIKPGAGSGPTEGAPHSGGNGSPSGTPRAVKWVLSILVCCVLLGVGALAYNTYFKPIKRCISEERLLEVKAPESLSVERPVDKSDLQDTVRRLLEQGSQKLADEYRELRTVSPIRYTENASLETNRHKNRYINILPFDDSRVELQELQGMVCSDYINASYIHEYSQPKLFIACQGPMKDTLGTFWRMIWEKNVHIIVMVTQCVESNKDKCQKYWPEAYDNDGLVNRNDNIKIITTSEENHGAYTIRRFKVSQNFRQREVRHFHYTAWPDMGCPDTPDQLINFVTTVREAHRTLQTPANSHQHLVVHCSAGVGRTGTFIGLWNLMSEIQEPKPTVDVFKTVFNMRYMRCNMVQTQIQYSFLYKCILRHYMQLNGLGDAIFVEDNRGGRPTTPDIVSSVRPNTMKSFQNSNAKLHGSSCDLKGETDTDIMEFSSSSESNNGKDEDNIDGKEESIASDDKRPSSSMYPNIDEIATAVCNEEEIPAEYTTTFGINENTDIAEKKV